MDRRLRLALILAIALHGLLVATERYRLSFDAYTHMFFADHYRQAWWVLWEPRWYAGFSVSSYPPLVHQLIAALSLLVGVEIAWAVVLLGVVAALPAGVYALARQFVGHRAAGYAALTASVLPSIFLTAHTFGQLPTLAGLLAALFCLAVLGRYLRGGRSRDGALAVALVAVVVASHHATLLFLPWGVALVGLHIALIRPAGGRRLLRRLLVFSTAATAAALLVVWPFWRWGMAQTMQTPIDHPSRHNFLGDPAATVLFLWPMYGPLVLVIPWTLRTMLRRRRVMCGTLFVVMFTLGLGGTTPLPRWLYGHAWEWLTYDRFALWASVALLPFVGLVAIVAERAMRQRLRRTWPVAGVAAVAVMGLAAFIAALLPSLVGTQPAPVDLRPIAAFLAESNRARWRYLTFGFGDQMARLSLLTDATTIDGSYHTARELPELRHSGIGQIDTAYWSLCGIRAIDTILERASARGVRWGFVNLRAYDQALARHGWVRLTTLANGVAVWENRAAVRPAPVDPATRSDPAAAVSWGVLPLTALVAATRLAWGRGYLPLPQMGRKRSLLLAVPLLIGFLLVAGQTQLRRAQTPELLHSDLPPAGPTASTREIEPLPADVVAETFVADADGYVVALAFAPDGRLFYTTKGGFSGVRTAQVRIVEDGTLRKAAFLTTSVETDRERGLLGIAIDPNFLTNRYVYIYKTAPASETGTGWISNRVIRYTEDPATQTALPESAAILLDAPVDAQNGPGIIHNGGNLHFGPDGKLYVTIGDYGSISANAQNFRNAMGKIHRLNPDGSVPSDNPFSTTPAGAVKSIWSYGHRNSFDFVFDPVSQRMFFTENGPECDDEVNLGQAGGNYGWPNACANVPAGTIAPLYRHVTPIGITGIDFYQGPIEEWHNTLFWCAINTKLLYHARLNDTRTRIVDVRVVDGVPLCAGDVQHGPDGALYLTEGATIFRVRLLAEAKVSGCAGSVLIRRSGQRALR